MEQSELNEERVFAKLKICPSLFEQLGSIQQYHKLCKAESKIDIHMLSRVPVGIKCLNIVRISRDLLIFEEINDI